MTNYFKRYYLALLTITVVSIITSCKQEKHYTDDELLFKAKAAFQKNDFKEAKRFAMKDIKQNPKLSKPYIMLGLIDEAMGALSSAQDNFKTAVELDPNSFQANFNLGRILYNNKNYSKSKAPLTKAYKLNPLHLETISLLAQLNTKLGLYKDAKRFYLKLARDKQYRAKAELWNELGVVYINLHKMREGAKCLLHAKKLDKDNPIVQLNLAIFCDKISRHKKAASFYANYLNLTKHNLSVTEMRTKVKNRLTALGYSYVD